MICICCGKNDCLTVHSKEEIEVHEFKGCYVCRKPFCVSKHTIEELRNPAPPTKEESNRGIQVCILYDRLIKSL
jgi:hypothetical protein